jgi:hypothetical protein
VPFSSEGWSRVRAFAKRTGEPMGEAAARLLEEAPEAPWPGAHRPIVERRDGGAAAGVCPRALLARGRRVRNVSHGGPDVCAVGAFVNGELQSGSNHHGQGLSQWVAALRTNRVCVRHCQFPEAFKARDAVAGDWTTLTCSRCVEVADVCRGSKFSVVMALHSRFGCGLTRSNTLQARTE